jgi:hypothetical protein
MHVVPLIIKQTRIIPNTISMQTVMLPATMLEGAFHA